jgi:hypothetical protein
MKWTLILRQLILIKHAYYGDVERLYNNSLMLKVKFNSLHPVLCKICTFTCRGTMESNGKSVGRDGKKLIIKQVQSFG